MKGFHFCQKWFEPWDATCGEALMYKILLHVSTPPPASNPV